MSVFGLIRNFLKEHIFKHFTAKVVVWIITALCVAALVLQYFSRPDSISILTIAGAVVVPFQTGINEVGGVIFNVENDRKNLAEANAEIKELESENIRLRQEVDSLNALALENAELRALLRAKERLTEYEMMEAEVIGSGGVNSFERFTINKGSADGVKIDMNVINRQGLVGIVSFVGLNYSIITSIVEDGTNVSVMTKNGHKSCIATGDFARSGSSKMLLENALIDVDFEKDRTLVTSNISDKYLPNLVVGYADNMKENSDHLTQSGILTTAVDFTDLKSVLVITTMKESLKEEGK